MIYALEIFKLLLLLFYWWNQDLLFCDSPMKVNKSLWSMVFTLRMTGACTILISSFVYQRTFQVECFLDSSVVSLHTCVKTGASNHLHSFGFQSHFATAFIKGLSRFVSLIVNQNNIVMVFASLVKHVNLCESLHKVFIEISCNGSTKLKRT